MILVYRLPVVAVLASSSSEHQQSVAFGSSFQPIGPLLLVPVPAVPVVVVGLFLSFLL